MKRFFWVSTPGLPRMLWRMVKLWRWASASSHRHRQILQRNKHLRREVVRLRGENSALTQRNLAVEQLSAELMRFNMDLSEVSRLDPMTGLLNRAAFEACMTQEHAVAIAGATNNTPAPYSVIMIDVDHFKTYNDTLGHPAGDACLVQVSKALQATVRKTDYVGRYGGEEMIVLCPGMDRDDAHQLAERLRAAITDLHIKHPASPTADRVTVSIGLATGPGPLLNHSGWSAVLLQADQQLYAAKHAGRDCVMAA